jgi:RNA-splicing ligase RtcB
MADTIVKPILVKGKYNTAHVYAKALETTCENKILHYLNHPAFKDTKVRIMPDVHLGKTTVIGWTSTYEDLIIPSVIGTDIGCGVFACNLGKGPLNFDKLDSFIRKKIPSGQSVRQSIHEGLDEFSTSEVFIDGITKRCEKLGKENERVILSLGTLGGGNHFIEIDADENHNRWLLVHSGSRIFGAYTAGYYGDMAIEKTDKDSNIKYLSGVDAEDYLNDLDFIQTYARINRYLMAQTIVKGFFKSDLRDIDSRDCIHNYIDINEKIVRKGSISAKKDEPVIIPFSMAEGAVLGVGKGNEEWNYSAPHGAGRKKARSDTKSLSLDEYRKEMRGIWSSVIGKKTLDESPMAYKKMRDIIDYISDAVEITQRLKPLYNFKAVD